MATENSPLMPATSVRVGLDLRARISVLRRRLLVLIVVLVGVLVAGTVITIRAPRVYRATALVLIDVNAPEVLSGMREVYGLGSGYWAAKEYYTTQYNVIKSRLVADKVVMALGLRSATVSEELKAAAPPTAEARLSGDPLSDLPPALQNKLRLLNLADAASRDAMAERLERLDPAAVLQKRLQVDPVKDSRLVQIAIEDTSPELAALLANAVADAYIEVNLDQKVDMTRTAVNWLSDQLRDLKDKLETSEAALNQFRRTNNMVSVSMEDRQTINSQTLNQLNQSLSAARAAGFALASRRDEIARATQDGSVPDNFDEVLSNPLIQKLKSVYSDLTQTESDLNLEYTPEHPKVRSVHEKTELVARDIQREIAKIVQSLDTQYNVSVATQQRLEREIQRVTSEALNLGQKEMEYTRLRREKDNNLALYEIVLKREKEANLSQMLKVNNVRKVDAARPPERPIRPIIKLNLLASLLIGLLGGVAVAFIVDYLDNSVKSQDQVEQVIGLPFLGIIPTIKPLQTSATTKPGERDLYIVQHPRSPCAECLRTIRTNIMFISPDRPARALLVSSSAPGEGKSTTVVNLAITMALLGQRTLLVDTDMRRPRLHKSFGISNDVGLSNLILGSTTMDEAIRPSSIERLDVLSCGPVPPNPAELLHTASFTNVFHELGKRYERILFDSPPVAAVADALVLASMVDAIVLVVHAGRTAWQATVQTKRRFEDVGGRISGVVLNNVDIDKVSASDYYYYRYYRYGEDAKA